jgi:hypothetical protein
MRSIQRDLNRLGEPKQPARSQADRPAIHLRGDPRGAAIGPLDRQAESSSTRALDDDIAPAVLGIALQTHHGELDPVQWMDGQRDPDPVRVLFRI